MGQDLVDARTLSDYNMTEADTVHMVMRLPGGAKKGVKKVTKQEKMHVVRAAAQYRTTQFQLQNGVANMAVQVADTGFIPGKVNALLQEIGQANNDQNIPALNDCMNRATSLWDGIIQIKRSDRRAVHLAPLFVPEIVQLEAEKARIEASINALTESFNVGFADNYYGLNGFNVDPFYDQVENALNAAQDAVAQQAAAGLAAQQASDQQNAMQAAVEAEVQRRLAEGAPPADVNM
jgi:hypothetical protein